MLNLEQPEKRNFSSRETSFIKYMTSHGLPTLCGGPNTEWKSESITIKYFYLTCAKIKVSRRKYNQRTYGSAYASKTNNWIRLVVWCSPHVQAEGQACPRPSMLSAAQNQPSPFCIRSPPPVEEHCDLCRNPTHCKICWWLWKLQTGLPRRPEVAKRAPSRAKSY